MSQTFLEDNCTWVVFLYLQVYVTETVEVAPLSSFTTVDVHVTNENDNIPYISSIIYSSENSGLPRLSSAFVAENSIPDAFIALVILLQCSN